MNCYAKIVFAACLTLFVESNVFADDMNITTYQRSFIRPVSSALIRLPNFQVPLDGVLTGGQPTVDQIQQAAATGFKAVINLRTDNELPDPAQELTWVEGAGMRYFHIPISVPEDLTPQKTKVFVDVLSRPENYPLIIHCKSGNRVGAMFALKAFHIDEKEMEEALLIGTMAGLTKLAPTVKRILESY